MQKKSQIIITIVSIILLLGLFYFILSLQGRIKSNPPGTIGNTAGNLNNGGLFCETDDYIFFANPYDNGNLYRMNHDRSNIMKLSNAQAKYINAGGNHLYYYQENSSASQGLGFVIRVSGVYRSNLHGEDVTCLKKVPSGIVTLVDDTLFFQNYDNTEGMTLYRMQTDKTNEMQVADYIINPASVHNGYLYFNGTNDDHNLYSLNTTTNEIQTVLESDLWNPIVHGDYVYYMDVPNNYRLCRYSFSNKSIEVLTEDRIDNFNVYDNIIYYQKNSTTEPSLKRMNMDGSNVELVAEGNFQNVNITSQYVYFQSFANKTPLYQTPTFGSINVTEFDDARAAAYENILNE